MRALDTYPSEEDIVNKILPQLQSDNENEFIEYDTFEKFMLNVLINKEYECDSDEVLYQAFLKLDTEKLGKIHKDQLKELLTSNVSAFRSKELDDFLRFACNNEGFIEYEEYIQKARA